MSSSSPPKWETSKENFQPLRSGRKLSAVAVASAQNPVGGHNDSEMNFSPEVKEKIDDFEAKLRLHSGIELLAVWHDYVVFVEQMFPRQEYQILA